MDKKFNLIDEKWILVRDKECNITEVSLKEALLNSHEYISLSGELPTQDIAIFRVMLAILHTVFSRYDVYGNVACIENNEGAFNRWKSIWDLKKLPEKPICDYFDKWYDRFWLIHPERPFWQLAELNRGTEYKSAKLNGEISESSNKIKIFSKFSYNAKEQMSFAQAARWLIHLNGFDDTSAKKTKEGKKQTADGKLPSTGVGWLGKLGLITIKGDNLFESLLYNMVMVNNGNPEAEEKPVWEEEKVRSLERTEIALPDNLAQLYTIQSRRLLLETDARNNVLGVKMIGGDFFAKENAFVEPMTVWKKPQKENDPYVPKRHSISKKLWREFASVYPEQSESGVIEWYSNYVADVLPRNKKAITEIVSVQYDAKQSCIEDVCSDSLSMSNGIILEKGKAWRERIIAEIDKCNEVSKKLYTFAMNAHIANGGSSEDKEVFSNITTLFYYRLDIPFRKWLMSINPDDENIDDKTLELQSIVCKIAFKLAEETSKNSRPTAIIGVSRGDVIYSIPSAMDKLRFGINTVYKKI